MMRILLVLFVLYGGVLQLFGQVELEFIQPVVSQEGRDLKMPFAGGINSAQYHTIDIDGDEDLDLIIFDRSSDKINCFENTGSSYAYEPSFEQYFPDNIQNWLVLVDYNCDGKKDLFTYTGQGIRVFLNTSGEGRLSWDLAADPLKTQGSSSKINLLFNPTDIPSIADLDGDGDLDILVFDFASSFQIELHENLSVDNTATCGLDFVRETRTFGKIRDCGCDDFTVSTPCTSSGRIMHAGGKAILSLDYNLDGQTDLLLSQEACTNLSLALNTGMGVDATFGPFNNTFPVFDLPIAFTSFPAAFYEDVSFDGKKDLLISSNERSNAGQDIDFQTSSILYSNEGTGNTNDFNSSELFLINEMIDVGENAYPAIGDLDGDGRNDLVLGNAGSLVDGAYVSTLTQYQSGQTGLTWQTDDLFQLSALGFTYIKPQFVDLNNDQQIDLIFSANDESNSTSLYYLLNQEATGMDFDIAQLMTINLALTIFDDFHFTDVDDDGLVDLLLGLSSGRLDYYRNTGTTTNPSFVLEREAYLGISINSEKGNVSLASGDLDGDGTIDLITTDRTGKATVYFDHKSNVVSPQQFLVRPEEGDALVTTRFGRISKPTFGQLLGQNTLFIGSIQGGVRLLATSNGSSEEVLTLTAYPVPSNSDHIVNFVTNQSNTRLEIFTVAGKKVDERTLAAHRVASIDLSHLQEGLYLAKATYNGQNCTSKIILASKE